MPGLKRPLKIFLCYAHADSTPVRALYARFTRSGVDAWLDTEKLLPGQDWEQEIRRGVRESRVVVVCLSKQFNKRGGYRHKELRIALEEANSLPKSGSFIIPARLERCDVPASLRRWQRVDLFEVDGYKKLIRALREHVDSI